MPTASPSSQPQVITVVIYFPREMLNGPRINWTPSVCDWRCTVEVMIAIFIGGRNIPKVFRQSTDMR